MSRPVVDPSADVDATAQLGPNVRIWHLAQVHDEVSLGAGFIIGRVAYIGSGVSVGENCKIQNHALHKSGRPHEDTVIAIATLSKGTIASHTVNWLSPQKERTTIVIGEKGALVADTLTADLTYYENGNTTTAWDQTSAFRGVLEGDVTRFALQRREPLVVEHETFRDAVLSGDQSKIVTLKEGARVVAVAEEMILDGKLHTL